MNSEVRNNLLSYLDKALSAIAVNDAFALKNLSSEVISDAAVFQDEDVLTTAVAIYSLSKIVEKSNQRGLISTHVKQARKALLNGNSKDFRAKIRLLLKTIRVEDRRLRAFVSSVIEQAQVKKGCTLCDYGFSAGRVSELLGVSKWDLMEYFGKTNVLESSREIIPTEKRLELARSLFK